jgi:hypothetical protein
LTKAHDNSLSERLIGFYTYTSIAMSSLHAKLAKCPIECLRFGDASLALLDLAPMIVRHAFGSLNRVPDTIGPCVSVPDLGNQL